MKSQRWIPIWIGRATFLVGLFDILASIFRKFRAPVHKLDHVFPVFLNGSALATSIFTGLVLMILARVFIISEPFSFSCIVFFG